MRTPIRVLMVEDSADDAELLLLELRRAGFDPTWERAETVDATRAALAAGPWDVILSDYTLPGFGALAALAIAQELAPDVPFVVVSGTIGEELAVEAMRAGAADYVLKRSLARLGPAVRREVREAENRRERRRAERAAFRLAAIVQSSGDAIIGKTLDGTITDWNPGAERLYGYTAGEVVGRPITVLVPPDRVEEWAAAMGRLRRGERADPFETVRVRKDGSVVHVSVAISPVRDATGAIIGASTVARDITPQRRAAEEVRRTADLLRAVAEGTTDAVFVKDRDGKYLLFNEAAARFVGKPVAEVLGRDDTALFDPASARVVMDRDRRVMAAGATETAEETLTAGGVTRTYLSTKGPHRDAAGNVVGLIGVSRDVTAWRRAEAERAALHDRLRLQVDRLPLGLIANDADFLITEWNPAAERMFGWTREEALGRSPYDLHVPPAARPYVEDIVRRLRAGAMDAHGLNENVTRDGRTIVCEWFNTPLFGPDGSFQGMIAMVADVTDRARAELDLRLRDRAIRAVASGIVITDPNQPDAPIIYASPGFERMTGYAAAEAVGRNCRFLQGPGTDPDAKAALRAAVRGGRECTVELLNYRKDGTPFWNLLTISPVRDDAGRLTHYVGVQQDVSERRRLEDQFRQAQKMEAVGRLAGGVAHDFNNLLTVINGYGEVVAEALPPGDPSRELVLQIKDAGERAASLTRQLLAFSRKSVLEPRVIDVNALVRDMGKLLRRLIGEDVELVTRLAPVLGRAKVDPGQLEQAVINLAVNARDAMPQGGRLTVETADVDLGEEYARGHPDARPGPYVRLAVGDTGHGMDAATKARVFEPFFTTKEAGKGTGLGLAMVFGFVTQSGGHVAVESAPGRGATFELYLPRVAEAAVARKSHPGAQPLPRGTETVLLVEDEDGVRALTRHVLTTCGYAVLEAANGREAVRVADGYAGPLHLVVTDVVMPGGMSGRAVAEAVRAARPGVRVLFVSGYTADMLGRHGVPEGGGAFLQKPFSPAALALKVREVLDEPA